MSAFVLAALPGTRVICIPHLSIGAKTAEVEDLASSTAPEYTKRVTVQALAHPSLTEPEGWHAYLMAEQAIACRDATDPDDWDYEGYADKAADRICDLIHGINTARGSRTTPTGESA